MMSRAAQREAALAGTGWCWEWFEYCGWSASFIDTPRHDRAVVEEDAFECFDHWGEAIPAPLAVVRAVLEHYADPSPQEETRAAPAAERETP